jgi:hypothetical protein
MLSLMVDPRGLTLEAYEASESGIESLYRFLNYCREFSKNGGSLIGLEEACLYLEALYPEAIDAKFHSSFIRGKDLIHLYYQVLGETMANAIDNPKHSHAFQLSYKSARLLSKQSSESYQEQFGGIEECVKQLLLSGWVLARENLVNKEDQFVATPVTDSTEAIQVEGRQVRYSGDRYNGSMKYVPPYNVQAYEDFDSLSRNHGGKFRLLDRCKYLDNLINSPMDNDEHRLWEYHKGFWSSIEDLKVWEDRALLNQLVRTCRDEVNKRDQDGGVIHQIRLSPSATSPQKTCGDWGAWQRDLSRNKFRLQFWRKGNVVQFAAVVRAHTSYDPPTPEDC